MMLPCRKSRCWLLSVLIFPLIFLTSMVVNAQQSSSTPFLTPSPAPPPTMMPSPPTFVYPNAGGHVSRSSPFTLQTIDDPSSPAVTGMCLGFVSDDQMCRSSSAASAAGSGWFTTMLLASAGISLYDSWTGAALLAVTMASAIPGAFGGFLAGIGDGTALDDAVIYNNQYQMESCSGSTQICNNMAYRFEDIGPSSWGSYGWITADGHGLDTARPRCLTKLLPSRKLAVKDCAYVLENGLKKISPDQMWRFQHNYFDDVNTGTNNTNSTQAPGRAIERNLWNMADNQDTCLTTESGTCRNYWVGTVYWERGCRIHPGGVPVYIDGALALSICGTN